MKKTLILLIIPAVIAFSIGSQSCTKTTIKTVTVTDTVKTTVTVTDTVTQNPPPTIVGFWVGSYKIPGYPDSAYESFDLRPDTTLLFRGLGFDGSTYYAEGTYSVTGTGFTYTFTGINGTNAGAVQTGTGTYSAAGATITGGTFQNVGTTVTGTFSLTKSQ
ncbi:MAG TPA: hypothetical protein VKR32_03995 [Puia sp.]|nr:hypothetical protein [Puia sp.]